LKDMIKAAVIGVGNMGKHHARVYSELKDCALVAVVDKNEKAAKEVATQFDCDYYTDVSDIIGKVDCASVVVPTFLHRDVAITLLENGIDVLLEKPIAMSTGEADEIIRCAEENGRILQIGHIERFNPAIIAARDEINDNPIALEANRIGPSGGRISDCGVILDLMIHDVDLILSLVDSAVKDVYASSKTMSGKHEDYAKALLTFENGTIASVCASRISQKRERTLNITLPDKYLCVDCMSKSLSIHKQGKYEKEDGVTSFSDIVERPLIRQSEPLKLELESFLSCVRERTVPVVTGAQGKLALEIVEGILEAANG